MKKIRWLYLMLILFLSISAVVGLGLGAPDTLSAAETAPGADCTVEYDKTAAPTEVDSGGVVTVTLSLQAVGDCSAQNSSVDVALVIDRSGSMSGVNLRDAKAAAISFVNQMDLTVDQVAVVSFASSGGQRLHISLSQNPAAVIAAINSIGAGGSTDIESGILLAKAELNSTRHITANAPVIIVLSDGHHNESPTDDLLNASKSAQNQGMRVISIGLGSGVNEAQLKAIASSTTDYYFAPSSTDLDRIYSSIASSVRVSARDMTITDTLSSQVSLVGGSFGGPIPPTVNGNVINWQVLAVPTQTLTLNYQVVMTSDAGTWPTNDSAIADYIDAGGNPASLTFPVPQVVVRSLCGQPVINSIAPNWACAGSPADLQIGGGGFVQPSVEIGGQALSVQSSTESSVAASLSSGLLKGTYDVRVSQCSPNLGALLPSAFVAYPAPAVLAVRPAEGFNDIPANLTICDVNNLAPGTIAAIEVPTGTVPLENQTLLGGSCINGVLPPVPAEWAGNRPVILQNACGVTSGGSNGTYKILPADLNDDLWGRSEELWIDPSIAAHLSEDISLGLIVHRRGGKSPLNNVQVRFFESDPSNPNAVEIGVGSIPLLSPRVSPSERISGTSTSDVGWLPSQGVGEYTLYAVIDPENAVPEDIEDNNVVSRTVRILPPAILGVDGVAPRVDQFVINGGADVTYDGDAALQIAATDFVQPNAVLSGIANMYFVEFIYNQAANVWVPVQASTWLSFTKDFTWPLVSQGGLRYMQAWTSDRAGNISRFPFFQRFNYIRPCDRVARNGSITYSQDLQVGETLNVEVAPCSGDPDLYIWPPDWEEGAPPFVSNQFSNATEVISFTATVSGTYQVEVYGFSAASYNIQIEVEPAANPPRTPLARSAQGHGPLADKPLPAEPSVPASSSPLSLMGVPPAPASVTELLFLPAIQK